MSRILSPIGGAGGGVDPVSQSNLVRYAKGQPTLVDPNSYVNSWSYDEDTGTLSVTYNAMATTIGPIDAPHFQWEIFGLDGVSVSLEDDLNDSHFLIFPLVTDVSYSGGASDRPSIGAGMSNTMGSLDRGCHGMWNKTGASSTGSSLIYYQAGVFVNKTGLDTAPSADGIGAILTYDPQAVYSYNSTCLRDPRGSIILPDGGYDSGQEVAASVVLLDFINSRYLDVWLGCAEWSGGAGSVPAGETISMTVAAVALPFFPRFLGSNFVKPA